MNYSPMENLKEFHDKFDRLGADRSLEPITAELIRKRVNLITEEFNETIKELNDYEYFVSNDMTHEYNAQREFLVKELADLLYVVYGTAEELSLPLEEVFRRVHESNMSKVWADGTVHYNGYGKVIKPPTYNPPDMSFIHGHNI